MVMASFSAFSMKTPQAAKPHPGKSPAYMRCEGLTALQAADFSIGGNGGKVKQQCAPGAMSPGGKRGWKRCPGLRGEPCPDARTSCRGAPTTAPETSGAGRMRRHESRHQAVRSGEGQTRERHAAVRRGAVPSFQVRWAASFMRRPRATKKAPCEHGAFGVRDRETSR